MKAATVTPAADPEVHASLWQARLLVLVSAVLWSSSGFFAKADVFDGWPGPLLAFWRAVFASLVLAPLAVLSLWTTPQAKRAMWSPWLLPMMLCFVAMNWTYLTAMKEGTAATAIWLQCTAPVWVLLVGVLVFGESFHRRDGLLIALGIAGVSVILLFKLQSAQASAVFYGLTSGVFYAGVVIFLRQLRGLDTAWLAAVNHLATAVCLVPYAMSGSYQPVGQQWIYLAAFGVLQMGIPYVLFTRGLRSIAGHEASGIGLIEPVLVPIWVYLAWGEQPGWPTVLGGSLIFSGLVLRYLGASRVP